MHTREINKFTWTDPQRHRLQSSAGAAGEQPWKRLMVAGKGLGPRQGGREALLSSGLESAD